MLISEAQRQLIATLIAYDGLEAQAIARIVLRDLFQTDHRSGKVLGAEQLELFESVSKRLAANEPVQYVTGWADFYGLRLRVTPDVLIPRQDTETLVEIGVDYLKRLGQTDPEVLDIGTGSGCIAIAIASKIKKARVFALDVSEAAITVAEANATLHHANVGFICTDVLKEGALPLRGFDLIVSNPPYIPVAEKSLMSANVLEHEPHLALFVSDEDPLIYYRAIIAKAQHHLYQGGMLAVECNEFNAPQVLALVQASGMKNCRLEQDLSGADRVVVGMNG